MGNLEIARWLQIASNIGILGGLVLVGFQLQQNSEILKTQVMSDESRRMVEQEWVLIGEEGARVWAKAMERPNNLDLQEQRIMEAFFWSMLEGWEHAHRLSTQGLVDIDWKSRISKEAAYYFGYPYARGWWNVVRAYTGYPQALEQAIDEALESAPDFTRDHHSSVMKEIRILTDTSEPVE